MCFFSAKAKPTLVTVTILNVDHSLEEIQKPPNFFSHQWAAEILGSNEIQAIKIDRTREILFAKWSRFKNENATQFIRNSKETSIKPTVFGAALLVPQGFQLFQPQVSKLPPMPRYQPRVQSQWACSTVQCDR